MYFLLRVQHLLRYPISLSPNATMFIIYIKIITGQNYAKFIHSRVKCIINFQGFLIPYLKKRRKIEQVRYYFSTLILVLHISFKRVARQVKLYYIYILTMLLHTPIFLSFIPLKHILKYCVICVCYFTLTIFTFDSVLCPSSQPILSNDQPQFIKFMFESSNGRYSYFKLFHNQSKKLLLKNEFHVYHLKYLLKFKRRQSNKVIQ